MPVDSSDGWKPPSSGRVPHRRESQGICGGLPARVLRLRWLTVAARPERHGAVFANGGSPGLHRLWRKVPRGERVGRRQDVPADAGYRLQWRGDRADARNACRHRRHVHGKNPHLPRCLRWPCHDQGSCTVLTGLSEPLSWFARIDRTRACRGSFRWQPLGPAHRCRPTKRCAGPHHICRPRAFAPDHR